MEYCPSLCEETGNFAFKWNIVFSKDIIKLFVVWRGRSGQNDGKQEIQQQDQRGVEVKDGGDVDDDDGDVGDDDDGILYKAWGRLEVYFDFSSHQMNGN